VIDERREHQARLTDDLRPHVDGIASTFPFRIGKRWPVRGN
jgi:hypothetical protein